MQTDVLPLCGRRSSWVCCKFTNASVSEIRITFGEVMDKSLVSCFFTHGVVAVNRSKPTGYIINSVKGKCSPYSITERRVPELILVVGSQPAGDVSHKPGGRLPLLSTRPAVTLATLKSASTNFAAW